MDIYRIANGQLIKGRTTKAIIHNIGYYVVDIKIYEDGLIDCWDKVDFDGFVKLVKQGWVVTELKGNTAFNIHELGYVENGRLTPRRSQADFIKEVSEILKELKGERTRKSILLESFDAYLDHPTLENRNFLKRNYEDYPKHLRPYLLGDQTNQDYLILLAIDDSPEGEQSKVKMIRDRYKK